VKVRTHLDLDDPTIVRHPPTSTVTRCLGRTRDGTDRASAVAMAHRLVARGYTEAAHPLTGEVAP